MALPNALWPTAPGSVVHAGVEFANLNANLNYLLGEIGLPAALTGAVQPTRYVGATTSGAPVTGTFAVGDFVIDQTGLIWVCTVAGTSGTWRVVAVRSLLRGIGLTSSSAAAGWHGVATAASTMVGIQSGFPMDRAGSVIGLMVRSSAAIASGTCTVKPTVNGSNGTLSTNLSSSATKNTATQAPGLDTFVAGDLLSAAVTGASTTTATVEAALMLVFNT